MVVHPSRPAGPPSSPTSTLAVITARAPATAAGRLRRASAEIDSSRAPQPKHAAQTR